MKRLFLLAILLLSCLPAEAGESLAPELQQLEKKLTAQQEAKGNGSISLEQYQTFLGEFRPELTEAMDQIPPSPENTTAHARILVLLGEHAEAAAILNRALEEKPGDHTLRLSLGQTQLESKDYAGALASANAILKTDPTNQNALFLKHQSVGRVTPSANGAPPPTTASPIAGLNAGTQAVFTDSAKRRPIVNDVPDISQGSPMSNERPSSPLWPMAALGAGLIGYGVYRNRRQEMDEADRGGRSVWSANEPSAKPIELSTEQKQMNAASAYAVDRGGRATWGANEPLAKPTELTTEQIAGNRKKAKVAVASVAFSIAAVYALPWAIRALPAVLTAAKSAGQRSGQSLQQVTASQLGAAGPDASGAFQRARALLNANQAIIDPRKLTEYALNPNHPKGMHKARVFKSALGITIEHAQELIAQVRRGIISTPAIPGATDSFGTHMTVDLLVTGPAGQAIVRTSWIYDPGSTVPRLATIFVK